MEDVAVLRVGDVAVVVVPRDLLQDLLGDRARVRRRRGELREDHRPTRHQRVQNRHDGSNKGRRTRKREREGKGRKVNEEGFPRKPSEVDESPDQSERKESQLAYHLSALQMIESLSLSLLFWSLAGAGETFSPLSDLKIFLQILHSHF